MSIVEELRAAKARWDRIVSNEGDLSPTAQAIAVAMFATLHMDNLFDRAIAAAESSPPVEGGQ